MKKQGVGKKITRTMLAMSLVYAGGMCADSTAEAWNAVTTVNTSDSTPVNENKIITSTDFTGGEDVGLLVNLVNADNSHPATVDFNGTIKVDAANSTAAALVVNAMTTEMGRSVTLNLKNDITAKAAAGNYALLLADVRSGMVMNLNVNPDENKTVQLLGDVGSSDGSGSFGSTVDLRLTNAESYLAGDLKLDRKGVIKLKLANGAVWYPGADTYTEADPAGHSDKRTVLELDGGIIDLYHSQPGVARTGSNRTFTLNDIRDSVSGNGGTTFRIGSDITGINNAGVGIADKVVLNGVGGGGYTGGDNYYIQIAADPAISSEQAEITPVGKIVVAQVDGVNMTKDNTTISGSKYVGSELDAGLTLADVTSVVEYDKEVGGWIIKKVTAENFRAAETSGEKGSAMTMAEVGASTALNIASAWRGENNDLLRRMGDLRSSSGEAGAWIRMYGGRNAVVKGQQSDMDYKAVQGGYDYQSDLKNGKLFTGFTVSHLDGDVGGSGIDGDINSTMFGLYSSYVGNRGHFADLIVKYGRVNNDFNTTKESNRYGSDYGSNGFSITTEYGYRQNLKNNFYIEPQAELTYSRIGSSDYTMSLNDKDGAKVSNDAFKSLIGRIGFNIGHQQQDNNIYAKLSLAREFQGDIAARASYGNVTRTYESGGSDTWVEYGIGFNSKLNKSTNLYGEVEKTTGSIVKTKWRANVGVRYSF